MAVKTSLAYAGISPSHLLASRPHRARMRSNVFSFLLPYLCGGAGDGAAGCGAFKPFRVGSVHVNPSCELNSRAARAGAVFAL